MASVAVLSSLGITYVLDSYKNKQDKNLRDEIKDRVYQSINDQKKALTDLEMAQNQIKSELVSRSEV